MIFLLCIVISLTSINFYIDNSASMAGYVGNGSDFSNLIYSFRNLSIESGIENVNLYLVSDKIIRSKLIPENIAYNKKLFIGSYSNLTSVLNKWQRQPQEINLLITDWVLSTRGNKKAVVKGYDLYAMKMKLLELINGGFYIVFIGVKSKFDGVVYSEFYNISHEGLSKFRWRGIRPFYILIASKDYKPTKGFTDHLIDFLKEHQVEYRILEFPLKSIKPYIDPEYFKVFPPISKPNFMLSNTPSWLDSKIVLRYSLVSEIGQKEKITVKIPFKLTGINKNILNLIINKNIIINWSVKLNSVPPNIPYFDVSSVDNALVISYSGKFLRIVKRLHQIRFNLNLTPEVINAKNIWKDWTTDDDSSEENANKTLYLSETLDFLIKVYLEHHLRGLNFNLFYKG